MQGAAKQDATLGGRAKVIVGLSRNLTSFRIISFESVFLIIAINAVIRLLEEKNTRRSHVPTICATLRLEAHI